MRRAAAAVVVPLLLLTAACGGGGDDTDETAKPRAGTIADVEVTGDFGSEPDVQFQAPTSFAKTESKTVIEGPGKGTAIGADSEITVNYVGINASDAETFDSTWNEQGKATPATFKPSDVIVGLGEGLKGATAGDRVLITIASKDGFDPVGNGTTVRKGDSLIMVVDVIKVVTPTVIPPDEVPKLQYDADGNPEKFVPLPDSPEGIGLLGVKVLEEGDGAVVKATDTLTVEYLGQVYPDGAVFDESYSAKKPVSFSLSGVIPGWTQGLTGQKVGSTVVLTIPSDLGYGAQGSPPDIPPNADLIFVVEILKAEPAAGQ